ncbi:response regulator transcription factor [Sulfurimonas sp.]|uniref:response regulator transcription factor n=1 Tax=Sulfurimonas sp. TaxID=2022749 RepID=UPI002AB1925E|nr:response regulator transcription factor [Sulfurimonas sp.]
MSLNFNILKQLSQDLSLLYVEDDKILRDKTSYIFYNLFKQVDTATDGLDGLNLYQDYYKKNDVFYDIVVTDIQMPLLDGISLSKEIFKLHKEQKIIVVSAYNDKEYLIDLINLGVEGFMHKPLSSQELLEILHKVCNSFKNDNIVVLSEGFKYNITKSILLFNSTKIELSVMELKLLHLLIKNPTQSFSAVEIFNHLYYEKPDKEFSNDSIKSLVKRLRKKTPQDFISNTQELGYSINL